MSSKDILVPNIGDFKDVESRVEFNDTDINNIIATAKAAGLDVKSDAGAGMRTSTAALDRSPPARR